MKTKVAGYIRVSSKGQEDNQSLHEQARQIQEYCNRHGLELVVIYIDVESAKTVHQRDAFKACVRYIWQDNADGLVVLNFDRYSRKLSDSELMRESFQRRGKQLISVQENFDLEDMFGLMAFQARQSYAEMERKLIARRLSSAREAVVRQGGWEGHGLAFGKKVVKRGRIKILAEDTDEAKVIASIQKRRKQGHSIREIRTWLNDNVPSKRGGKWSLSTVHKLATAS